MENQHRKIKGYRELSQAEIDLMNEIKEKGVELSLLIEKVNKITDSLSSDVRESAEPYRWSALAKTHFQQGLMALTRAVAKPVFF